MPEDKQFFHFKTTWTDADGNPHESEMAFHSDDLREVLTQMQVFLRQADYSYVKRLDAVTDSGTLFQGN